MFSTSAGYYSVLPFSTRSSSLSLRGCSFASVRCCNQLLQNQHVGGICFPSERGYRLRKPHSNLRVSCLKDSKATVVTGESWDKLISQSDIPVLVEFYASWCGPCRMVHRVIEEIAGDYSGRLKCFVLNTDEDSDITERYDIKAVPVIFLYKNGEKCESVVGTMPKEYYVAAIERVLSS